MNLQENIIRILEIMDSPEEFKNQAMKWDALFVGGLEKEGFPKLHQQLANFKEGFGNKKVIALPHHVSFDKIVNVMKVYPKIPIFLYSAGCNHADELMDLETVDKNKVYLIEPFNNPKKGLNSSVSRALGKGLKSKNIFVAPGKPGRGHGFSGASNSDAGNHFDSPRTVGKKFAL